MAQILGFVIVAVVALFIAWPLLERRTAALAGARLSDEVADLLSRRDTLYRELADLDFDHRLGKVDDEDYAQQREDYLDAAALVLLRLDSMPSAPFDQAAPLTSEQQERIEEEIRQLRGRGNSA